jgi:hypothetical protein
VGENTEVAFGDADLDRSKYRLVDQQVARFTQENEAIGANGRDVMDGQVLRRAAGDARRDLDAAGPDQPNGLPPQAVAFPLTVFGALPPAF